MCATALCNILYTSSPSEWVTEEHVAELALASMRRNRELEVTGCLWYHPRLFVQVLEGAEHTLEKLYANIRDDPRHQRVTTIAHAPIAERRFDRWGFQVLKASDQVDDENLWRMAGDLVGRAVHLNPKPQTPETTPQTEPNNLGETLIGWLQGITARARPANSQDHASDQTARPGNTPPEKPPRENPPAVSLPKPHPPAT